MIKLTAIESAILRAVATRRDTWLNCNGTYVGEVLALQAKGLAVSRVVNGQLQVCIESRCERCGEPSPSSSYCDECLRLSNNDFYAAFYPSVRELRA